MTDFQLFPGVDGPGAQSSDSDDYTMAVEFYATSTAWFKALRFWAATTVTGSNHVARLYRVIDGSSGPLIATATLPSPLVSGWNSVSFSPTPALVTNVRYRAAVYFTTNNGYTATPLYWTTGGAGENGITSGILVAPRALDATGASQGSFTGSDAFPNGQFNATNYWVDPVITDVAPPPEAPTVGAGDDVSGLKFGVGFVSRTATETDNGATITARAWTIQSGPTGAGSTLSTSATLSWAPPSPGTYTLRYTATNSVGSGFDDAVVGVNFPPPRSFNAGFFAAA